jgi:hypothetical protein
VLDLGGSGGIDSNGRSLEPFLVALGLDFNIREIERLNDAEKNKNIRYFAGNLELPPDHPIRAKRGTSFVCESHKAFTKTSAWDAYIRSSKSRSSNRDSPKPSHVHMQEFLKTHKFKYVDFVKIDIDGPDFDVLQDLEKHFESLEILGFKMEVNFTGTNNPHDHSFHNMDRMMRSHKFELMDLELRRYTHKTLPGKFLFNFFGQTETGALAQGDAIYIKQCELNKSSKKKIVKTIILLTLFGQIDSAAALIKEGPLCESLKLRWLDLAAQKFSHKNYAELMKKWEKTPNAFFRDGIPSNHSQK